MMRLLKIELLKLLPAKYFWILMMIFLVIMIAIPVTTSLLSDWVVNSFLSNLGVEQIAVLFDFNDIWQNFTFVFQYFTVLLSSLVLINIAQEFSLTTARQQVIDGLSRKEFFKGKLIVMASMALAVAIVATILCLVFGYLYSPVTDLGSVLKHIQFIPAYFLHLMHDFLFAMFISPPCSLSFPQDWHKVVAFHPTRCGTRTHNPQVVQRAFCAKSAARIPTLEFEPISFGVGRFALEFLIRSFVRVG